MAGSEREWIPEGPPLTWQDIQPTAVGPPQPLSYGGSTNGSKRKVANGDSGTKGSHAGKKKQKVSTRSAALFDISAADDVPGSTDQGIKDIIMQSPSSQSNKNHDHSAEVRDLLNLSSFDEQASHALLSLQPSKDDLYGGMSTSDFFNKRTSQQRTAKQSSQASSSSATTGKSSRATTRTTTPATTNPPKYRGVSYKKKDNRWIGQIKHQRSQNYLGIFRTPEEAARAYDVAARQFYGRSAKCNFKTEAEANQICEAARKKIGAATVTKVTRKQPTSKYRGVSFKSKDLKWVAQLRFGGKQHHLGMFESEKSAALAYDISALENCPEKGRTNFNMTLPELKREAQLENERIASLDNTGGRRNRALIRAAANASIEDNKLDPEDESTISSIAVALYKAKHNSEIVNEMKKSKKAPPTKPAPAKKAARKTRAKKTKRATKSKKNLSVATTTGRKTSQSTRAAIAADVAADVAVDEPIDYLQEPMNDQTNMVKTPRSSTRQQLHDILVASNNGSAAAATPHLEQVPREDTNPMNTNAFVFQKPRSSRAEILNQQIDATSNLYELANAVPMQFQHNGYHSIPQNSNYTPNIYDSHKLSVSDDHHHSHQEEPDTEGWNEADPTDYSFLNY